MDTTTTDIHKSFSTRSGNKIIHGFASMPHYRRHVDAVFKHLHPSIRGNLFGPECKIKDLPEGLFLVASFKDAEMLSRRKVVYLEHGAGQSYKGDKMSAGSPYYHGAKHPQNIVGYVSPNEQVASSWGRPAIAVGCPALDVWHLALQEMQTRSLKPAVTLTFHWDCRVAPESRWALPHYAERLPEFVEHLRLLGFDVFGHAHPRAEKMLKRFWHRNKVEYLDTPEMVFWASDILIADNTSLLFEFASLDRPVVLLNAPWYRKHVHHGGRFWDWADVGINVDQPEALFNIDFDSYLFEDRFAFQRAEIVKQIYAHTDGFAGQRAAKWVTRMALEV